MQNLEKMIIEHFKLYIFFLKMIDENGSFGMGRSKKGPDPDRVQIY